MADISGVWRELNGSNSWEGLLEPLDDQLRHYIIHCGEQAGAPGDAFNAEEGSPWKGFSRYPPEDLYANVGLVKGNRYKYEVTKFFYARIETDKSSESNWIGFVAVVTDEETRKKMGRRDILISWRGTNTLLEFNVDIEFNLVSAEDVFGAANSPTPQAEEGFHSVYTARSPSDDDDPRNYSKLSAREQVLPEVQRLVNQFKDEDISITVTGHSLGAALATMNAADIVANGYNKSTGGLNSNGCMVTAIVFASPRVGDQGFLDMTTRLNLHILRITNATDIVPTRPDPTSIWYKHVGQELVIDSTKSPYLKKSDDWTVQLSVAHILEIYLHGVAGFQKKNGDFKPDIDRDLTLLNKGMDVLNNVAGQHHVPASWMVEKNRGMIQQEDGNWKLEGYVPPPPTVT